MISVASICKDGRSKTRVQTRSSYGGLQSLRSVKTGGLRHAYRRGVVTEDFSRFDL